MLPWLEKKKKQSNWKNLDVLFITGAGKNSVVSANLGNLFMDVLVWSTVLCTLSIINFIGESLCCWLPCSLCSWGHSEKFALVNHGYNIGNIKRALRNHRQILEWFLFTEADGISSIQLYYAICGSWQVANWNSTGPGDLMNLCISSK